MKKIKVVSMPFPKGENARYDVDVMGSFFELDEEKAKKKPTTNLDRQTTIFDFIDE